MHERTVLYHGLGISVVDFRCRATVGGGSAEEPNPTHSIVFVRRGAFRRAVGGDWFLADPNHVLFFNANQEYRYEHPLPGGDDCTILAIDSARAMELVAGRAPRQGQVPEMPFQLSHAPAGANLARLHYEMLGLLHRGAPRLVIEDVLAELADRAICEALDVERALTVGASISRRREMVEMAKLSIHRRIEKPPSLGELAEAAGCSLFRLSRDFHSVEGVSLRRYLCRLRLRLAAQSLARGAPDLTDLALDLGYGDQSHFTNAFRREWDTPPARFRDRLHGPLGRPRDRRGGRNP